MKRKTAQTSIASSCPTSKDEVFSVDLSPLLPDIEFALDGAKDVTLQNLTPETFVISSRLKLRMQEVMHELQHGSGAVLLRFPPTWIRKHGEDICQRAFFGLCSYFGRAVTQSTDLQELCARVEVARTREVLEAKHTSRRGYRNDKDQYLHVDSSIPAARGTGICDVLAMLCIRPARQGGTSKIASASAIFAHLQQHHPELLARVERGFMYNAGSVEYHPDWRQPPLGDKEMPMVFMDASGKPCVQYAKNMVETITAMYSGMPDEEEVKDALKRLEEVCSHPSVVQYWDFCAGEAYLLDNYRWLHARTQFEDDPKAPRLFFRLWLQVQQFDSIESLL